MSFIDMYSVPLDTWKDGESSSNVLDQWIMTRLAQVIADASEGFESYNTVEATKGFSAFVDDLSAWYLRRSRDRFKSDDSSDRVAAGKTLITVLREFAKVIAPVMPFVAEEVWQKLKTESDAESVHLEMFPNTQAASSEVLEHMGQVRNLVTLGLEVRQKANIKVRQPLSKLFVPESILSDEYLDIIKDELNVKEVVVKDSLTVGQVELDTEITENLRNEGDMRDMVRTIQDMRKDADLSPSDRVLVRLQIAEPIWFANSELKEELLRTVGAEQIVWGSEGNKVEKR